MLAKTPVCCCKETPDPGPWQAGVNDAADQGMVSRMHAVRDNFLRNDISNEELVKALRISVSLDQRTRLGYHIQCCILHLAASRLELLAAGKDPSPWAGFWFRVKMALTVLLGEAAAVRFNPSEPR